MSIPTLAELIERMERTPLTDPRALGSSLLFHVLILIAASAAVLSAASPSGPEALKTLRGELDPVDNRARSNPTDGGGSPGELGADQLAAALASVAPSEAPSGSDSTTARTAPADALLSEILPTSSQTTESLRQALPGPQTSSLAQIAMPSARSGGGGGSGGGTGGGIGRGIGPGTEFFGAKETATSFAYVIDCSGSMAFKNSLDVAKRELNSSLHQLSPEAQFAIVFYNLQATMFSDPRGQKGMMAATPANKARVGVQLSQVLPDGGTDHMVALRSALTLHPEVIFFLTDADQMTSSHVGTIVAEAGPTRIQAIEFGRGFDLAGESNPLRRLAAATGGTYRYIDVTKFPRSR